MIIIVNTKKRLTKKQARKIKYLVESQGVLNLPRGWHVKDVIR